MFHKFFGTFVQLCNFGDTYLGIFTPLFSSVFSKLHKKHPKIMKIKDFLHKKFSKI